MQGSVAALTPLTQQFRLLKVNLQILIHAQNDAHVLSYSFQHHCNDESFQSFITQMTRSRKEPMRQMIIYLRKNLSSLIFTNMETLRFILRLNNIQINNVHIIFLHVLKRK